jgi:hypothetical protein
LTSTNLKKLRKMSFRHFCKLIPIKMFKDYLKKLRCSNKKTLNSLTLKVQKTLKYLLLKKDLCWFKKNRQVFRQEKVTWTLVLKGPL